MDGSEAFPVRPDGEAIHEEIHFIAKFLADRVKAALGPAFKVEVNLAVPNTNGTGYSKTFAYPRPDQVHGDTPTGPAQAVLLEFNEAYIQHRDKERQQFAAFFDGTAFVCMNPAVFWRAQSLP